MKSWYKNLFLRNVASAELVVLRQCALPMDLTPAHPLLGVV